MMNKRASADGHQGLGWMKNTDDGMAVISSQQQLQQQQQQELLQPLVVRPDHVPEKQPTTKDEVTLLCKELNEMSIIEREQVYEEIHGVDEEIRETPEMMATALMDMEVQISKIKQKPAYEMALQMDPNYVNDGNLRIMFLRSDYWNPNKAAQKLVQHFEYKLDLWGRDKLCKSITLEDLDDETTRTINSGGMQILPQRDKSGRPVIVECPKHLPFAEPDNVVRFQQVGFFFYKLLFRDSPTSLIGIMQNIFTSLSKLTHSLCSL